MKPVDALEITILVDNTTDSLSSNPDFVEPEFAFLRRHGMKWLSGKCICCATHGLSCLITARYGKETQTLLFDTGPDEWVFERNVTRLGLDLGAIGALVLSHGHWDHGGAMPRALQMIAQSKGAQGTGKLAGNIPVYMHPEMFALRAVKRKDGDYFPMELVPSVEVLAGSGGDAVVTREEQSVLDDAFYVSGEIPRVTQFERGFPGQHRRTADGGWEKDEVMPDERFVSVHVAGKGQIVFTACSHAGLINVLHAAKGRFPDVPLYGVLGGFHLSGITEAIIPDTVEALAPFNLKLIAAGHCTGWRALNALATTFGDAVVPTAAGKTYRL